MGGVDISVVAYHLVEHVPVGMVFDTFKNESDRGLFVRDLRVIGANHKQANCFMFCIIFACCQS